MRTNFNDDNRGFTLVELLVALLVSSLVVLAASMFLSVSVSNFNTTNTEVSLQTESQIALNLVENLMIEATSCEYIPEFAYNDADGNAAECELIKIGSKDATNTYLYLVILNPATNQLLLKKMPPIALTETNNYENVIGELANDDEIKTMVESAIAATRPALLANYVSDISVSPNRITTDTNDLIHVNIYLERNNKNFNSSSNISMRNGIHR